MIKKFIVLLIMHIVILSNVIVADNKPVFVLSTIRFDNDTKGVLVPEIAVDVKGNCRKSTTKDLWVGQKFQIFDRSETPKPQGSVTVSSLTRDFYAFFESENKMRESAYFMGVYRTKQFLWNIEKSKGHKPENINRLAQQEFLKKQVDHKKMLQRVVTLDWNNLRKDFSKLSSSNISEFVSDDINDDKKDDYILILSNLDEKAGAAVIIYLSDGTQFKRIPILFWEEAGYDTYWPRILYVMDFNGDGTKEIVLSESDSDINLPIIYSWIKDKGLLMRLYYGKEEFWSVYGIIKVQKIAA